VTAIGNYAFFGSTNLTAMNVDPNNAAYTSVSGVLFNKNQSQLVCYPAGKSGSYQVPNNVTSIADGAFAYCYSLTSITIPSSVTSIGDYAFYSCASVVFQ
jgi:hypothetical protein